MTSEDIGPRLCDPCRWDFHEHCQPEPWCECVATFCYERVLEGE